MNIFGRPINLSGNSNFTPPRLVIRNPFAKSDGTLVKAGTPPQRVTNH